MCIASANSLMSSESSSTSIDASPASTAPSSVLDENPPCPILTDYAKFRPAFHLQPRTGWLNDPCAPGYDHRTKLYHVSFQHNPNGPDWGDICWSSMTSPDLIHWTRQDEPTVQPDRPYDSKGVFTGCLIPPECLDDDEPMTIAYTSVNALPIHHTLTHIRGSESLSLARSVDHGKTWTKANNNPILPSEPESIKVTGWRDPFVAPWASMSRVLGIDSSDVLFSIISGGIRDTSPTTFLYSIDRRDLAQWHYRGPLIQPGLNHQLSRWSGDFGKNWEVTNFMTLTDERDSSISREFLVMGTEGCVSPPERQVESNDPSRPVRGQLWLAGALQKKDTAYQSGEPWEVELRCDYSGFLDHGCLYAANSFFDPVSQKQVAWGWVTEEDLCDELRHAQGWSGMLSLPRELFIQTLEHVTGTIGRTFLRDITSIETKPDQHGSFTVRTLASQPVQRLVESLRHGQAVHTVSLGWNDLNGDETVVIDGRHINTKAWELDCSFHVASQCRRIGVEFVHSASQSTVLAFDPTCEKLTIDRPSLPTSDSHCWINSSQERAPHTLFTFRDVATGVLSTEPLRIQMWRDNSVIEVFVNGRTAISSRIFAADTTVAIRFFADDAVPDGSGCTAVAVGSELEYAVFRDGIGKS